MNENVKRLFHVRFLMHPCYAEIIATRPEIRLDKLENDSPDSLVNPITAAAHAYQVSSARDELHLLRPARRRSSLLPRCGTCDPPHVEE